MKPAIVTRDKVVEAFGKWSEGRGLTVSPEQTPFVADALEEMVDLTPGLVMNWYLANQYRYAKMTEIGRRGGRMMLSGFLTDLQMGRLAL